MVQAARLAIDRVHARRHAREAAACIERLFRQFHSKPRGVRKGFDAARFAALLCHAIERHFRCFDLFLRRGGGAGIHGVGGELSTHADQFAQQRQIVNLPGKIARADQRRTRSCELGEIGGAAELPHGLIRIKHRFERDRVRHHVAVCQQQDGIINAAMNGFKKMFGAQRELDILNQPVVDHERAEQRRFRLHIMGQGLGDVGLFGNNAQMFSHGCLVG
jgi:hypothetical protein